MNEPKTYKLKGMHCASCSAIIEKTLKKTEGVNSAEANYGNESVKISFDETKINPEKLSKTIEPLGYSLVTETAESMGMSAEEHAAHTGIGQSKAEKLAEIKSMKQKVIIGIILASVSIFSMVADMLFNYSNDILSIILLLSATYMLFFVGRPYLLGVKRFIQYRVANMDTLIGIGTSVAYVYSILVDKKFLDISIIVIAFITLGKYLEARSKIKTGDAIEKLLGLQAKTALVVRDGKEIEISIDEVFVGDIIIIKPGAKIPVDGVVVDGESYVDESMISGEPMPVHKEIGANVSAGTINISGSFHFKTTKIGSETLLAHIIKMVEDAQGSKAPIQALADKISSIFVPIVLVIAFVSLGLWILIGSGPLGFSQAFSLGLTSFVSVLVIACPCALGLATPTAIIVGVGKGAREGILIKDAATLEKLHQVNVVLVDKTGTITKGKPEVVDIKNLDESMLSVLASLENKSEHPIAHAIINYSREKNLTIQNVSNFEAVKGKGLKGIVSGVEYFVGNAKFFSDMNISFDRNTIETFTAQGKTPVILGTKEKVLGFVMVADEIKMESKKAVEDLHALGIKVIMLTGDEKKTADYIAGLVGIDEVVPHAMPEDKINKVKALQAEGMIVAMAGDGINDAPALAQADVAIAMGTGTDVAIEAAGITLLNGDISKLVKAIKLSKITMRGIKQNLFWAFFYNVIGIPLATGIFYPVFGWLLSPVFAGFAMAMSSVSVVSNSLRIKAKKL